jgi:glycosyltransferase involved in cell wall biosynthesis
MMDSFLVLVPVYNGAFFIRQFLDRVPEEAQHHLCFIDDGSTDGTGEILKVLKLWVITHRRNRGKGVALRSGFELARKLKRHYIVTLDIDLQHPPEQILAFLPVKDDQVCLGYRRQRDRMPLLRQFSNFATSLLITVRTGQIIRDSQCGYRGFPSQLIHTIQFHEKGFQFESEFLIKAALAGYRIHHVEIPTIYDAEPSAMNNITDTLKFVSMWFRSFFWS